MIQNIILRISNWILSKLRKYTYKSLNKILFKLDRLIMIAEKLGITDEQEFINIEDKLNALSIKEHPVIKHPTIFEDNSWDNVLRWSREYDK